MSIPTTTNQTFRADSPGSHFPVSAADIACGSLKEAAEESIPDIEHIPVNDDPRKWSHIRKACSHLDNSCVCTVDNDCSVTDNNAVDRIYSSFDFNACVEYAKSYVKFSQRSMEKTK